MASEYAILAKLGGFVGSNPEIVSSYPSVDNVGNEGDILNTCFPTGAKIGDFYEDKYKKYLVLSYIFRIKQLAERDDLFSLSILLHKREKVEVYKPVLKTLVETLEQNGLLNEEVLKEYHKTIYEGINDEKDVQIKDLLIDFSRIFTEIKAEVIKQKPELKGSFF